jgi:hypothetical protein
MEFVALTVTVWRSSTNLGSLHVMIAYSAVDDASAGTGMCFSSAPALSSTLAITGRCRDNENLSNPECPYSADPCAGIVVLNSRVGSTWGADVYMALPGTLRRYCVTVSREPGGSGFNIRQDDLNLDVFFRDRPGFSWNRFQPPVIASPFMNVTELGTGGWYVCTVAPGANNRNADYSVNWYDSSGNIMLHFRPRFETINWQNYAAYTSPQPWLGWMCFVGLSFSGTTPSSTIPYGSNAFEQCSFNNTLVAIADSACVSNRNVPVWYDTCRLDYCSTRRTAKATSGIAEASKLMALAPAASSWLARLVRTKQPDVSSCGFWSSYTYCNTSSPETMQCSPGVTRFNNIPSGFCNTTCGGADFYCVGGVRYNVSAGYFSTPDDTWSASGGRTGQSVCPKGSYCMRGIKVGDYASYCLPVVGAQCSVRVPVHDACARCLCTTCWWSAQSACGTYNGSDGGYVSAAAGATRCTACGPGRYDTVVGTSDPHIQCDVCPSGTYSNGTANSACRLIPYVPTGAFVSRGLRVHCACCAVGGACGSNCDCHGAGRPLLAGANSLAGVGTSTAPPLAQL